MNVIESYSLQSGQKIKKPLIEDTFFPLPFQKWISFSPFSKPSKSYNYWNSVLDLLVPILQKEGISIVQIGARGEEAIRGAYHTQGQTNFRQAAYIIKNSLLHFGADSFSSHLSGIYNKPLVSLYAANYTSCVRPYWGDKDKQILLEADRKGNAPSFSFDENPKTINTIPPEKIVASICKLLNLEFNFGFQTIFIGDQFHRNYIEGIPNQVLDCKSLNTDVVILRMDEIFSEEVLARQAQQSKVVLVTDRPVNLNLLKQIKPQILEIAYEVKEENDPNWVQAVIRLGIKIGLFSFLSDDQLNKHKLKYLDLPLIIQKKLQKPEILEGKQNLYMASNRFILSNGKIHPSIQHYKQNYTLPEFGLHFSPLIDNTETLKELDTFWIVEKIG